MSIDPKISGWPNEPRQYMEHHGGATFTVELGELIDKGFDLGLDKYPIFDEEYRAPLNAKIVNHYWFREIGFETPQLFKRYLNVRMNEIMPFYNQLYESERTELQLLSNVSMTTEATTEDEASVTHEGTRDETGDRTETVTSSADTTATSRNLVSQTPQMQLAGHEDYASNIADAQSDSTTDSDGTTESRNVFKAADSSTDSTDATQRYLQKVTGLTGVLGADALMRYRETFLNVDMLIVEELADLFMGLYTDYANYF